MQKHAKKWHTQYVQPQNKCYQTMEVGWHVINNLHIVNIATYFGEFWDKNFSRFR